MQTVVTGDLPNSLFNIFLIGLVAFLSTAPPLFLLLHFLMPKDFFLKYWAPPYFQPWELEAFGRFPGIFMRTTMLTAILAFPALGRKRNMSGAALEVATGYRVFAKAYWLVFFSVGLTLIGLLLGLLLHLLIFRNAAQSL